MSRVRPVLFALALAAPVACVPIPVVDPPKWWNAPDDPEAAKKAANGVRAFGTDLYAQLRTEPGNLVFSPYSANVALTMTALGAQGNTRTEMSQVLHIREPKWHTPRPVPGRTQPDQALYDPDPEIAKEYAALASSVMKQPEKAKRRQELSVANSLWMQKGRPWRASFLATARDDFRAGLFEVDFARNPEAAAGRINRWVEKETRDRIQKLIGEGTLTPETRLVLANAVYFKARWESEFKKKDTEPLDFTRTDGTKVKAPLMFQQGEFHLSEGKGFQVLRMPYDGGACALYVMLPSSHDGLPGMEGRLTADTLAAWTGTDAKASKERVNVWLPRFKFTVPVQLTGALERMGMKEAFSDSANFKGMTDSADALKITDVLHKAFVELDEQGTEAAAATAVVMGLAMSAPQRPEPPVKEFRADRPFLFALVHEPTGAPLFLGRVLDPTK
jgi:serpin B